jgi:hypothetical protein
MIGDRGGRGGFPGVVRRSFGITCHILRVCFGVSSGTLREKGRVLREVPKDSRRMWQVIPKKPRSRPEETADTGRRLTVHGDFKLLIPNPVY